MFAFSAFAKAPVRSLAFAPDGRTILASTETGMKLFDALAGREIWSFEDTLDNFPEARITSDGTRAVALARGRVLVLAANDGRELAKHSRSLGAFALPPDPDRMIAVTAAMDTCEQRELNLLDGTVIAKKVLTYHGGILRVDRAPDGRTLGTVGIDEGMLLDLPARKIRFAKRFKRSVDLIEYLPGLAFSPDGGTFVYTEKAALNVCDVATGKLRETVAYNGPAIRGLAFARDGAQLFAVTGTPIVAVWDARSWTPSKSYAWKAGKLCSVAVSPDGTLAAAGSETGKVVVWDVEG